MSENHSQETTSIKDDHSTTISIPVDPESLYYCSYEQVLSCNDQPRKNHLWAVCFVKDEPTYACFYK